MSIGWSRKRLTEGVVVVGHDIGEGIGNVATSNDLLRLPCFVGELCYTRSQSSALVNDERTYEQEGEDDAADEEPFADGERDEDTAIVFRGRARVEDLIRPRVGGQHGYGGEDIGHIDKERLEYDGVQPKVPKQDGIRVR